MLARFDWRNPDYVSVFSDRLKKLNRIREKPECIPALKVYYRDHPAQFINDWGVTFDPRLVERDLPGLIPFILFPKQVEWIEFAIDLWRKQRRGITEKSRDEGLSWLSVSLSCTLCLHFDGMSIGFGSRKEEYVDRSDSPKSLFWKARTFMRYLPREFRGGWDEQKHGLHMRLSFPETGSHMAGEAGDNIGRGDRTSIYFVDESAHLERPQLIDAALSQTTNCRIDISSPNGNANSFAENRWSGKIPVFTLHWKDDPRKDQAWYDKQVEEINNLVIIAQEIDIDYSGSVEGVLIPSAWVQAAIDAEEKLGVKVAGVRSGAIDIADQGQDLNAFCGAYGIRIDHLEEWSGKNSDILHTAHRAFRLCDNLGYESFKYDADGLGAGMRGDARSINEIRKSMGQEHIKVEPFWGSGAVQHPTREDVKGRANEDFFANFNAQSWWGLRLRFQLTYRAVIEKQHFDPDQIISIPSDLPLRAKLVSELSQPTYHLNGAGKIIVDKAPEGAKSPNLADAVKIRFSRSVGVAMRIKPEVISRFNAPAARMRISSNVMQRFGAR
jgi:phage terminase large subunit